MPSHQTSDSSKSSSLSRRGFLAGTAMGAAALAMTRDLRGEAAKDGRKIKLGVVGCGGRGAWIAGLFREHGGYDMHAVADLFPEVANTAGDALGVDKSRRFSGLSGYRKLIDSGVEAVALETPPCFFPEHVQAAVDAGLHVYMAKPIAVDVAGCLKVDAAAKKATQNKRCFLIDYQMPTDPHNLECAKRLREGGLGSIGMVKSFYYGGLFSDPPMTENIESRLRSLVWVNDTVIGGSYHVNACIHAIQAVMWALDMTPVAAVGVSRVARAEPHGDSHDMYGITYEFANGLIWTHSGRHAAGLTGPEDPLAYCEFLGDAYMRIGYGGKALIRGGAKHYPGGSVENLYKAGAERNIATFHRNVLDGNVSNDTVRMAVDSCLTTMLGRDAGLRKGRMTMEELLKENRRLEVDLKGLKP